MDTNFFLNIEPAQIRQEKNGKTNSRDYADNSKYDFDLFFRNFTQERLIKEDQIREDKILKDQLSSSEKKSVNANEPKDQTLEEAIASLEAFLSANNTPTAEIYNIEDFSDVPVGQIITALNGEQVILSDPLKAALLDRLTSIPVQFKLKEGLRPAASHPLENTEATLNGDALFERILENLSQGKEVNISLESIIAAGISPQDLETLSQQNAVSIESLSATEELNDDLISLLGLMQSLPVKALLTSNQGKDPLQAGSMWIEDSIETDGSTTFKQISTLEDLKAALAQKAQVASSKAELMINNAANENMSGKTFLIPVLVNMDSANGVMEWFDPLTQEWTSFPSLPSALNGTNITSVLTQAAHAQAAHPATQMIAASIQKNAGSNENRNWTMQLDPPDLGKVEIEMKFSHDKLVKAHMVIEKPETWMMLQRDAQVLERALQNAGLDVTQDDISFELAENGFNFSENTSNGGQTSSNPRGTYDNENIEIIETTMNWYVDPQNGLQRYNLMV